MKFIRYTTKLTQKLSAMLKPVKMSSLIKNLHIKNFKSVRDLSLDCDRINIFIGKPNAGKSNILEAISLLGAGYSEGRFMEGFIRYKSMAQFFSNFDYRSPIEVRADRTYANIRESAYYKNFKFSLSTNIQAKIDNIPGEINEIEVSSLDMNISINGAISSKDSKDEPFRSPVKKYDFKLIDEFREKGLFLHPPHGDNFYLIARSHAELREEIHQFLKPNGLEFLLDEETKRVAIVHKENTSLISFPLHLVPDTFQRYIFHLAAIMSNRDSVLLFEEPESHSYAPYVYQLAQHILNDEGGNQYFITTHSPYFLLPLMQEGKDVAVFATWFEDYQTHARRLSAEEIREMLDYGVDVFLNLDHFIPA